jgi:hypothetical protein
VGWFGGISNKFELVSEGDGDECMHDVILDFWDSPKLHHTKACTMD